MRRCLKIFAYGILLSMGMSLANAALIIPDSYDKLLAKMNGTTTTFVDSSTANPKTITANGNATQLSLHADFAGKRTAMFFNGTTDYVVVPDSDDWDFGTEDYEVQVYVNFSVLQNCHFVDFKAQNFAIGYLSGNLVVQQAGYTRISQAWTPTVGTWYKLKAKRVSGTTTLYKDDEVFGIPYSGSDTCNANVDFFIGKTTDSAQYFSGWMKNLTITKAGTTVLDMRADSPANSPLGPAIYFDGTGDSLKADVGTDFNHGTNPFTYECFAIIPAATGNHTMIASGQSSGGYPAGVGLTQSGTNIVVRVAGANRLTFDATAYLVPNRSNHFAAERDGNTLTLYINGISRATADITGVSVGTLSGYVYVGSEADALDFAGYIREARISTVARYQGNFTPSQTGFTVDANTLLYIKGSENNGVTTFVDSETTPKTVTTNGDTKIKYTEDYRSCIFVDSSASAHHPYPQGSAKIDFFTVFGSGVYWGNTSGTGSLSVSDSDDWDMSSGIFTAEAYVRSENLTTAINTILCQKTDTNANWRFWIETDGSLTMNAVAGGVDVITVDSVTAGEIVENTWYYVAVSENGDSWKNFLNGTDVTRSGGTNTSRLANLTGELFIGKDSVLGTYFQGRVDNVRISKGIARYTATFNPPEDYEDAVSGKHRMFQVF